MILPPGRPVRVLIVDDHELFGDSLRLLLEQHADLVTVVGVARDGEEAVAMAAHSEPEIVLMDIGLPRIDGFEAARRLLALKKGARVIAMTGRGEDEVRTQSREAGIVGYLSKDHIDEHVLAMIGEIAARG